MPFPTVAARQASVSAAADSFSFSPTIPAASSGDFLVAIVSGEALPTLTTSSAGWTKLAQQSGQDVQAVFYKTATSSDTLTADASVTSQYSAIVFRLTGLSGWGVSGTGANSATTNADPPSHDAGAVRDHLWIVTYTGSTSQVPTAAPANYGNLTTQGRSGTNGVPTATAERELSAQTENPGAFTSGVANAELFTLAVWGAAGAITAAGDVTLDPATGTGELGATVTADSDAALGPTTGEGEVSVGLTLAGSGTLADFTTTGEIDTDEGLIADSSVTLGDFTSVGTAGATITADGSAALGAVTSAGSAVTTVDGASSVVLGAFTGSGTITAALAGSSAVTLADATGSGAISVGLALDGAATLNPFTTAGTIGDAETLILVGAVLLEAIGSTGSGSINLVADASATLGDFTSTGRLFSWSSQTPTAETWTARTAASETWTPRTPVSEVWNG